MLFINIKPSDDLPAKQALLAAIQKSSIREASSPRIYRRIFEYHTYIAAFSYLQNYASYDMKISGLYSCFLLSFYTITNFTNIRGIYIRHIINTVQTVQEYESVTLLRVSCVHTLQYIKAVRYRSCPLSDTKIG